MPGTVWRGGPLYELDQGSLPGAPAGHDSGTTQWAGQRPTATGTGMVILAGPVLFSLADCEHVAKTLWKQVPDQHYQTTASRMERVGASGSEWSPCKLPEEEVM